MRPKTAHHAEAETTAQQAGKHKFGPSAMKKPQIGAIARLQLFGPYTGRVAWSRPSRHHGIKNLQSEPIAVSRRPPPGSVIGWVARNLRIVNGTIEIAKPCVAFFAFGRKQTAGWTCFLLFFHVPIGFSCVVRVP